MPPLRDFSNHYQEAERQNRGALSKDRRAGAGDSRAEAAPIPLRELQLTSIEELAALQGDEEQAEGGADESGGGG